MSDVCTVDICKPLVHHQHRHYHCHCHYIHRYYCTSTIAMNHHHNDTMCGSRKYPYSPHGRSLEIPRGRGCLKAKLLEGQYEA